MVVAIISSLLIMNGAEAATASAVDYAQCTNGAPEAIDETDVRCNDWINGILQGSNSHYSEDEVTPQRLVVKVSGAANTEHSVELRYQTRKGTTHAYDSLTTWNHTQEEADRCLNYKGATRTILGCGSVGDWAASNAHTSKTTGPIPADNTSVTPCDERAGTDEFGQVITTPSCQTSLRQIKGDVTAYGQVAAGSVSVANLGHEAPTGAGDDYAVVRVSFRTSAANGTVQILFGGHLAAPELSRGWGEGYGAANINGGPYHIKWEKADGASIGNRDNQIMGSAIVIQFYSGRLSTQASPSTALAGVSTVLGDTATYVTQGSPTSGAVTFGLYGPFTAGSSVAADACFGNPAAVPAVPAMTPVSGSVVSTSFAATATAGTFGASTASGGVAGPSLSLTPGDYYWAVSYAGDGFQNLPTSHGCGVSSEKVAVSKAQPTAASTIALHDTMTVTAQSGGATPGGTVNFKLHRTTTATCDATNLVYDSSDPTKGGTGDPTLTSGSATSGVVVIAVADAGTYEWVASYSGDANNEVVTKACGTETAVISY